MKPTFILMESLIKGLVDNRLIELDLSQQEMTDEQMISLAASLTANTSLRSLLLQIRQMTDRGAQALLEALKQNTSLTFLELYGHSKNPVNRIMSVARGVISSRNDYYHLNKDLVFTIDAYVCRNQMLKELRKQQEEGEVIQLDFSQGGIDEVGVLALASVLEKDATLLEINLGDMLVDNKTAEAFVGALKNNRTLITLKLNLLENKEQEASLRKFIERNKMLSRIPQLIKEADLGEINLKKPPVGDQGAAVLAEAFKRYPVFSQVKSFDLRGHQIGPGIIPLLNNLDSRFTINKLILDENPLTDKGAKVIAKWIQNNKTLTYLGLAGCEINADGMLALAQGLLKNSALKEIDLRFNHINLEGVQAFAELILKNATLTRLELSEERYQRVINKLLVLDRSLGGGLFCQAAKQGDLELVQALYLAGADLEQQDKEGNTPLCLAISYDHIKIVDFLIHQGANIYHTNTEGNTPSKLAAKRGKGAIITSLERAIAIPEWLKQCLENLKNTTITALDLSSAYFSYLRFQSMNNQHMRILVEALKNNQSIKVLNLANNKLGETTAQFLQEVLRINTTLIEINLSGNECLERPIRRGTLKAISQSLERNKHGNTLSSSSKNSTLTISSQLSLTNSSFSVLPSTITLDASTNRSIQSNTESWLKAPATSSLDTFSHRVFNTDNNNNTQNVLQTAEKEIHEQTSEKDVLNENKNESQMAISTQKF